MKKYVAIGTAIFIIVLLIFLWLINRPKTEETLTTPSTSTFDESSSNGSRGSTGTNGTSHSNGSSGNSGTSGSTSGSSNGSASSLPVSQQQLIQSLIPKLPYTSDKFEISYNIELDKFLVTKKSLDADTAITAWAKENGYSSLFEFITRPSSSTAGMFLVRNTASSTNRDSATDPGASQGGISFKPFVNNSIQSLTDADKRNLQAVKNSLPQDSNTFAIHYTPQYDTYIVQKKTPQGDADIKEWASENYISNLISNPGIFTTTNESPVTHIAKINQTYNETLTAQSDYIQNLYDQTQTNLYTLFEAAPDVSGTPFPLMTLNPAPTSIPIVTSSPGTIPASNIDVNILELIRSYGLPAPQADGAKGYTAMLAKLRSDERATWSASQLLSAERFYESKNPTGNGLPKLNRYLTTAWLWWENGAQAAWPDPNEVNCDDEQSLSAVSVLCSTTNFQVAGYQAATRRNDYLKVYRLLYSDSELQSVLQNVVNNSEKGIRPTWRYRDNGQQKGLVSSFLNSVSSATIKDISPNSDFFNNRTQFFTLMLGKDPKMVIGLNTFAVSEGDLICQFKRTDGCPYNAPYYCGSQQTFSNMIAALYLFDTNSTSLTAPVKTAPVQPNANGYVFYSQRDSRFNPAPPAMGRCYADYAGAEIGMMDYAGCGPTTTAMIISTYTGKNYTPLDAVAEYSYFTCQGTTVEDARNTLSKNGVKISGNLFHYDGGVPLSRVQNVLKQYLNEGWTIYTLVKGHFIWITSIDGAGNVYSQDPYYGERRAIQPKDIRYVTAFAVKKQ